MESVAGYNRQQSVCEFLEWDSRFFDLRVGRMVASRLTPQMVTSAFEWAKAEGIDCLYLLADSDDPQTIALAEAHGFNFRDIRVTLECALPGILATAPTNVPREPVRTARPQDIPALRSIAAESHRMGRFYSDPYFSDSRCDDLYQTWIEKSCKGYADTVLVVEHSGQPAGYLSCHLSPAGRGTIGLVGVDSRAQRQGLGLRLVQASLRYFQENGMNLVTVVTQGSNCPSQRLYQFCGFRTQIVQLWYHRWFHRPCA
jgi:dTDP-4-amino-4,6-dideoxy-D-galactose acyltransferase